MYLLNDYLLLLLVIVLITLLDDIGDLLSFM